MKENNQTGYFIQGIIFLLMVGSICQSVFEFFQIPVPYLHTLGIVLLLYIVFSLYFRNALTFFTLFISTVLLFFLYVHIYIPADMYEVRRLEYSSMLKQMSEYMLGNAALSQELVYPLAFTSAFVITLLFFFVKIKLKMFVLPVLAGAGVFFALWFFAPSHLSPYIWMFIFSVILYISEKSYFKLSSEHAMPDYSLWQLSAFMLAAVIIATSFFIMPADTKGLKWEYLEQQVEQVTDIWSGRYGFTGTRKSFRLSQVGFPSSSGQLGGPVTLTDEIVMEVTSPFPLYLRGAILNEYTGTSWINTISDKRYKFTDSSIGAHIKNRAFDLDEPVWELSGADEGGSSFITYQVGILHTGINTSVLFNALHTDNIFTDKYLSFVPYYNGKGETFTSRLIKEKEPYILEIMLPGISMDLFIDYIIEHAPDIQWTLELSETLADKGIDPDKLLHVQENYLHLPTDLPSRVTELAKSLTKDALNPLEKALAIQAYLKGNHEYTLEPPHTPEGRDFTDYFLFDLKRGYCTYFATSMVVLARASGLPARYIEGFSMPSHTVKENLYEVRKENAHAWAEVYFPGAGWVTFDPTPIGQQGTGPQTGEDYSPYDSALQDFYDLYDYYDNYDNRSWLIPDVGENMSTDPRHGLLSIARFILITFILSISGILVLLTGTVFIWHKYRWVKLKNYKLVEQLKIYYSEIMWLMDVYEFPVLQGETPYAYAKRVDRWLINDACSMNNISHLITKTIYGSYPVEEKDIEKIKAFYHNLEEDLKKLVGLIPYFLKLILRHR